MISGGYSIHFNWPANVRVERTQFNWSQWKQLSNHIHRMPNGICLLLHQRFWWVHFSYALREIISVIFRRIHFNSHTDMVEYVLKLAYHQFTTAHIIKLIFVSIRLIQAICGNESVRIENRSSHSCGIEWNSRICHSWSDSIISIFKVNLNEWISNINTTANRCGCKCYKLHRNNSSDMHKSLIVATSKQFFFCILSVWSIGNDRNAMIKSIMRKQFIIKALLWNVSRSYNL